MILVLIHFSPQTAGLGCPALTPPMLPEENSGTAVRPHETPASSAGKTLTRGAHGVTRPTC